MKAQLTLSVNSAKWLIAKAILRLPEVREALQNGKIILKGGTTVSCVAEELLGIKLRISGRITKRGTVGSFQAVIGPHSVLIEKGTWTNIDDTFLDEVLKLGPGDVIITGANLIDCEGNAAMMAGSPGGGNPGRAIAALTSEGIHVIVAAGLEKLIPGRIPDIIREVSRKGCDFALGMSFGLMPIFGRLVTEIDALKILGCQDAKVIGRGGIDGAEGSTVVLVEGDEAYLKAVINEVLSASGKHVSGIEESLKECSPGSPGCAYHLLCCYSKKSKLKI